MGLGGNPADLAEAKKSFGGDGAVRVSEIVASDGKRELALLADEFSCLPTALEVHERAPAAIVLLSGALSVSLHRPCSLCTTGRIYERSASGSWDPPHIVLMPGTGSIVLRGFRPTVHLGDDAPPSTTPEAAWVDLGSTDEEVGDVLRALASDQGWPELWKAEEVILPSKHVFPEWPHDEVQHFRASATIDRHSATTKNGRRARKYFADTGKPPMSLHDARHLIGRIARPWLDWKVSRR